jgi:hypothetical protein
MSVNAIRLLTEEGGTPFVPPPDSYEVRSESC